MNSVLVVEDNFSLAAHWQLLLEAENIRVIHETSAEAAIECLKSDASIGLVITDMVLEPGTDPAVEQGGLLVLAYVSLNIDPAPKVIGITGASKSASFNSVVELLSPENVLRKPVADQLLVDRALNALAEHREEMDRRERAIKTEAELKKAMFSVEHASDAIFWIQDDGSFSYVNQKSAALLGYSRDELCQLTVADIDPSFSAQSWADRWREIRMQRVFMSESRYRRKDGSWFDCEVTEHFLELDGAEFVAAEVQDTTMAKQAKQELLQLNTDLAGALAVAEESERRFRTLADSASPLFWMTELDSSCSWLNKRWIEYSGRELSEQVGDGWIETIHPEDRDRTIETYSNAHKIQQPFEAPYRLRRHDGEYRWHTVNGTPRFDESGQFVGYVGISFDDHDAKKNRDSLKASQRELKKTTETLQATISLLGTSDGVWEWRPGSLEATFAPGFRKLLGFDGDDVEGFPNRIEAFESRIHPKHVAGRKDALARCLEHQTPYVFEFRVRHKDGRYVWVRSRATADFDDQGKPTRLVGSIQDISEQKELELERDRFFNTAAEIFAVVDLETIMWKKLSPTWTKIFGYRLDEIVDTPVLQMHPREEHQRIVAKCQKLLVGEPIRNWVCRMLHRDGSIRFIEWNIDPPMAGETVVYGTGRDVTILREYTDRIEEASDELSSINRQLARSNKDLSQFAYVASHDLQEPLRAVSGFLQLLGSRYRKQLDETGRGYIKKSVEGAARMSQLINDLLHFSRVSNDRSEHLPVDLNLVAAKACEKLNRTIEEANANVQILDLPTIIGIELLLEQLFVNLIGNAVKYRSEKKPQIVVSWHENEDGGELRFADNGIGIPDEYRLQVFEMFKRLHRREEYIGTGIGLAICQRVVERHGGSIAVQPVDDGGSCFSVSFPRNANNAAFHARERT